MKNEVEFLQLIRSVCSHNAEISVHFKDATHERNVLIKKAHTVSAEANFKMVKLINQRIELIRLGKL